jgi:hypothetical protein
MNILVITGCYDWSNLYFSLQNCIRVQQERILSTFQSSSTRANIIH